MVVDKASAETTLPAGETSRADEESPPLAVDNLQKSFGGRAAVAGLSFSLRAGECFGLLGRNGAGKTTTIKMCLGHLAPDGGGARVFGRLMSDEPLAGRRRMGVVPQSNALDPDFDCLENLQVYARYFGFRADESHLRKLLDFAGLGERAHEKIPALSGGMQRRLTLARALVNNPDLLLLDEPSTGLDPQARHLIWDRLHQLRAGGKTLLLTTHFMEEAERLCDRLLIVDEGKAIAEGAPAELIQKHVEPLVVEVVGARPQWGEAKPAREERFGNTTFCYAHNAAPLLDALQKSGARYLQRPANLEDVFLKLTGRDLRGA